MSPQKFEFLVLRGMSLSVGMTLLLGTSAMALPQGSSSAVNVAQANSSSAPDVVVDTVPTGRSTTRTSTGSGDIPTGRSTTRTSTGSPSRTATSSGTRFSCELLNGEYTVMYNPQSQPNQSFPWATPSTLGDGWTSERRCDEISQRLESYRADGLLELTTDVANGYNTVCVTTENDPSCRIVFTVPPGQDPMITRDRVFQNLTVADNGQQTTAINTYVNRGQRNDELFNIGRGILGGGNKPQVESGSINLQPFLDKADGGTGTQLLRGVPNQDKSRLNPGNFRN